MDERQELAPQIQRLSDREAAFVYAWLLQNIFGRAAVAGARSDVAPRAALPKLLCRLAAARARHFTVDNVNAA